MTQLENRGAARWVGQSVKRREDIRLVTGRGRYVDDVTMPGLLHAHFVRSPAARGTLSAVDVTAARELPGVAAVLTAEDVNPNARSFWVTMMGPDARGAPMRVLAHGDVRYVGEPIALVVAESRYLAEDAAELVGFDLDPRPAVVTIDQALSSEERVHPELGTNVAGEIPAVPDPEIDKLFAEAGRVVTATFDQHRYLCVPMEPRGLIASWDPWQQRMEIVASTQTVHETRAQWSRLLGVPEDAIHVVMGDVGGSFGQKMFPGREDHAIVIAAKLLGRPVKWIEDRAENLIAAGHAREESMEVSLALDADGRITAARARHLENVGAYPLFGDGMSASTAAGMFPGPYRMRRLAFSAQGVFTNTSGHCAYRGPWMMETTAREQIVDIAAAELGLDPLELRRRNVIQQDELPFTTATGLVYTAVSPAETLEQAAELIGYETFRKAQEDGRAGGRYLGVGLSLYIEPQFGFGILGTEAATIRIEPSGAVNVLMSTGSHGQSLETTVVQVVADELGVSIDDIRFFQGDSAATPYGPGTGGSRSAAIASGAAIQAAQQVREKVLLIGAHLMEAAPDDVEIAGGAVSVKGDPAASVPLAQVAAVAYLNTDVLPPGVAPGLETTARWKAPMFMFSNACHAATVEVDPVTGQVKLLRYVISEDCGNMINPMVVEGQIAGGVAQGIGGVFYERFAYDEDGNPLTTTFLDYQLPTAAEVPDFEYGHVVTPAPTPGGFKGMGEGGAIASPAALINAVRDALRPFGARITAQPLTPEAIVRAIDEAGRSVLPHQPH
ncbi:MAG TPA: xanthine dehydrogenase family protein molybdopterin-binding subunit [Streptosporangiaceae bacterium]|nr:xanthine dehydrogenase family protein molybdopterin-binding subunit [Streptosporangiaceae bacterium]